MKAFNEKCDRILLFLKDHPEVNWKVLFIAVGVNKNDALLNYLKKEKSFIDFNDEKINITRKGLQFISTTSFTAQRDKKEMHRTQIRF